MQDIEYLLLSGLNGLTATYAVSKINSGLPAKVISVIPGLSPEPPQPEEFPYRRWY